MTLEEALTKATIPVPVAGRLFLNGLGRNASYEAAKRGDIPVIEVGGKKLAIVAQLAEKVGLRSMAGRAAT